MKRKHFLYMGVLSAPLVVLFLFFCERGDSGGGTSDSTDAYSGASIKEPVAVEAVRITKGVLARSIEASGTLRGAHEATVVSETQGVITSVSFDLGAYVKKNSVLVRVDDRVQKPAMESAKKEYETAQRTLNVTEKLYENGGVSQTELERARAAAARAKAAYEQARKAWEDCAVRAPISGYVASREQSLSKGNYLSRGVRIARIVDLRRLRVEIPVGEREVGLIEKGSAVAVRLGAGCREETVDTATVTAIAAGADPSTGSFTVAIEWKNECGDAVRSGMTATVTIPSAGQDTVVVVPTAALVKREGRDAVLTAAGDRVVVKPVRTGRMAGNRTHILEGVAEGDTVIMSALGTLAPNNPVIVSLIGESGIWK
jgi:membrane fusion protein (multidrug efflux system)